MAHPYEHAKSSVRKWGGQPEDYLEIHEWFDATKGWVCHSKHSMFRHHSEGIFEMEQRFGSQFTNSDGKIVYTRYVGEQHVREDCDGYIPTAREWYQIVENKQRPLWSVKTKKLEFED